MHPPGVSLFHDGADLEPGVSVPLDEGVTHHIRVRRLEVGSQLFLLDGRGLRALARLELIGRREVVARVLDVEAIPPPSSIHMLVPVADRERMLWLAEKSAELALSSWRPTLYHRSRSVSPRGEGDAFAAKVRLRMASALEQSGGAWLPRVGGDASLDEAIAALPAGDLMLLDRDGEPILARPVVTPVTFAVGPEGGLEPDERRVLLSRGFRPVRLADNILRFETAAVAALAVARAVNI